jgi:hypothetical protein
LQVIQEIVDHGRNDSALKDTYLGVDVNKFRIPDSNAPKNKVRCWAFESITYVKKTIPDLKKEPEEAHLRLLPNAKSPLASGF